MSEVLKRMSETAMCVPAGVVWKKHKFPERVSGLVCPRRRKEAVVVG